MAPTICSEKKRQIRSSLKEIRRQQPPLASSTAGTANSTAAAATATSSNSLTANSTIINYVAKGSLNSRSIASLRVRGIDVNIVDTSHNPQSQLQIERLEAATGSSYNNSTASATTTPLINQISDSAVSSSTQLATDSLELLDASTSLIPLTPFTHSTSRCSSQQPQYYASNADSNHLAMETDDDDDDEDSEADVDAELHSIGSTTQRQLLHCTVKTVFPTHHNNNNKSSLPQMGVIVHSNSNSHQSHDCDSCDRRPESSDTFSHMCEIKNTEGLLAIALKTIKLVKRNQLLQRRLAQLQLETSEFIQSVLANPENRHFRDKMQTQQQNGTPAKVEKLEWKGSSRVAEV